MNCLYPRKSFVMLTAISCYHLPFLAPDTARHSMSKHVAARHSTTQYDTTRHGSRPPSLPSPYRRVKGCTLSWVDKRSGAGVYNNWNMNDNVDNADW